MVKPETVVLAAGLAAAGGGVAYLLTRGGGPPPPPPLSVTAIGSPTTGQVPVTVSFHASASGGTGPYTYAWNFGDGTTGTGATATHSYTVAGNYAVTVTVTDSTGKKAVSAPVDLSFTGGPPPHLTVTASASPTSGLVPVTVAFHATATGGVPPYTYSWAFGDGTTSTLQNPTHTYTAAGNYTARVTVTDSAGTVAASSPISLSFTTHALSITATASPTTGQVPVPVTFTSTPTGGVPPYTYAWTFGDGATSTSQNPSHTYAAAGTYTADVRVMDSAGTIATSNPISLTFTSGPPPVIKHVFVAWLENSTLNNTLATAPYLKSLYATYGQITHYFGTSHPSAPNYLAFACGALLQDGSDACKPFFYTNENLIDRLEAAGVSWVAYAESATSDCPSGNQGAFACRHYPWTYFKSNNTAGRCAKMIPVAQLLADYPFSATPPAFTWLGLDVNNDGHDTSVAYADSHFFSKFVPLMMAQPWWKDSILLILTDENGSPSGYSCGGQTIKGGQIFGMAVGAACVGKSYTANASHYNLLATVLELLGLPTTLGQAGTTCFPPMSSLYK